MRSVYETSFLKVVYQISACKFVSFLMHIAQETQRPKTMTDMTWHTKTMPDMTSGCPKTDSYIYCLEFSFVVMSGEKTEELYTCNHLHNFGI